MRRALALARRLDPALLAIVCGGFGFAAFFALRASGWLVMTDELIFSKAGLDVGRSLTLTPEIRHQAADWSNILYSLLTAPAYQLFDMPGAFRAVHALNALLMASAAIPAYLLTRDLTGSRTAARLAAVLTVAVPWMAYSMVIMTEPLGYPLYAWALYAIYRAVATPSASGDLLALGAIVAAGLTRTQFVVLAPAFAASALAHEVGFALHERGPLSRRQALLAGLRNAVARHRTALGAVIAVAGVFAVWFGLEDNLSFHNEFLIRSGYQEVIQGGLFPAGTPRSALAHFDYIAIGTGILPAVMAVGWALGSVARPSSRAGHAFALLALIVLPVTVLQVTSFNLRFATLHVQDRYLFYVVPIFFAGMAACVCDSRRRWPGVLAFGGVFAFMVHFARFEHTLAELPRYAAPDAVFHQVLNGRFGQIGDLLGIELTTSAALTVIAAALALGAAWVLRTASPRATLLGLTLPVLAFCVVESGYVLDQLERTDASANWGVGGEELGARDWVDDSLPGETGSGDVALIPSRFGDDPFVETAVWWDTEFWNKTIGRVYAYAELSYDTLPQVPLELADPLTGRLDTGEEGGQERYLVVSSSDARFRPLALRTVTSRERPGFARVDIIEPRRPWRAEWATQGLLSDGWTQEAGRVQLRFYANGRRRARRAVVSLYAPPGAYGRRAYEISGPGRRVAGALRPGQVRRTALAFCVPARGFTEARIRVRGLTELPDGRRVGLRVLEIATSSGESDVARPGSCG